tara:strand:+ start:11047 stop:12192 length:1146 start_codon:yes stop_codon:yes gene_type:complete
MGDSSSSQDGVEARKAAIDCVRRIDEYESYANIVLVNAFKKWNFEQRDKNLITEIVYGATRMQRALDWAVDRYLIKPPPAALRASLRIGAYQLLYTRIPPHAAVSTTVEASSKKNRGVVNAVLRRVAEGLPIEWPNESIRLSYPDWLIELVESEYGMREGQEMLEYMNSSPPVTERDDGYIQDLSSQWVVENIDIQPKELILDLCAAPGGKATAMAAKGACVVASDLHHSRSRRMSQNIKRLRTDEVLQVTTDGVQPCFAKSTFDKVLVDAPCSGLGVLHRRADARWRIKRSDIDNLAILQLKLLRSAKELVKPGGELIYSVCTITEAETSNVIKSFTKSVDGLKPIVINDSRWRKKNGGVFLLPQDHETDGMSMFKWEVK